MLGILAAAHAPHGWRATARDRQRTQRRTGLGLCVLAGALVVSGYLLYYFAPETVRPTLGWVHSIIGVAMLALGLSHARRSRR